ncbi:hypothetical protein CDAR_243221 [Caerostris darwini]|uniref:Uncharacterized protein n=1 Tax=Caerostris darwini TaxID=1538125 RepID=A0AAV4MLB2_9ARAC|nr:hypothetical protein CDAR_243221 [Caerostris darwini]
MLEKCHKRNSNRCINGKLQFSCSWVNNDGNSVNMHRVYGCSSVTLMELKYAIQRNVDTIDAEPVTTSCNRRIEEPHLPDKLWWVL